MARGTGIAEPAPALYPDRHGDLALCECRPCITRRQLHALSKGGVLAPGEQSEPPDVDRRVHSLHRRQEIIEVFDAIRHPQPAAAMANPDRLPAKSPPDGLDGRDMDLCPRKKQPGTTTRQHPGMEHSSRDLGKAQHVYLLS